jgi:hypothetical protein
MLVRLRTSTGGFAGANAEIDMEGCDLRHDLGMAVSTDAVTRWFDEYLDTFAACVRGEQDMARLLDHYGVPLIVTSDDGVTTLMTDDEASAVLQGMVDGLRALGYHHTEVLNSQVTLLNSTSAVYRGTMSRRDRSDAEIGCPTIGYLVTEDAAGLRIAVLATHDQ